MLMTARFSRKGGWRRVAWTTVLMAPRAHQPDESGSDVGLHGRALVTSACAAEDTPRS